LFSESPFLQQFVFDLAPEFGLLFNLGFEVLHNLSLFLIGFLNMLIVFGLGLLPFPVDHSCHLFAKVPLPVDLLSFPVERCLNFLHPHLVEKFSCFESVELLLGNGVGTL
jgi:hypothetical protein